MAEGAQPSEPLLTGKPGKKRMTEGVEKLRESLSEQTPSNLLLLALLFGIVAGVVAFVYSK